MCTNGLKVCLKVFRIRLSQRDARSRNVVKSLGYRFHFAVGLYSDNLQRTSKRGKNISHGTRLRLVAYFFALTTF